VPIREGIISATYLLTYLLTYLPWTAGILVFTELLLRTLGLFTNFSCPLKPIHTADDDATQLSSWVASAVCTEFATSWRQSRRVWTIKFADSEVELRRVCGVNAPVGSRDPVYNFLCCWAIEVGDKWRHRPNDVVVEKSYQYRSKSV